MAGVGINMKFNLYFDSKLITAEDTPRSLNIEDYDVITITGESKLHFPIALRQQ